MVLGVPICSLYQNADIAEVGKARHPCAPLDYQSDDGAHGVTRPYREALFVIGLYN